MTTRTRSSNNTSEVILVPELQLAKMIIPIKGLTPLLTNRMSEKSIQSIEDVQTHKAKQAKEPRDPHQEFLDARHVTKKGTKWEQDINGFPAIGIKEAVVSTGMRIGAEKGTILKASLNIEGDLLVIKADTPVMRTDFVRHHGVGSLAYRPAWFPWEIDVPILFLENVISKEQVVNLFRTAGFAIGIGSWRPEKNGTMGQFEIAGDVQLVYSSREVEVNGR